MFRCMLPVCSTHKRRLRACSCQYMHLVLIYLGMYRYTYVIMHVIFNVDLFILLWTFIYESMCVRMYESMNVFITNYVCEQKTFRMRSSVGRYVIINWTDVHTLASVCMCVCFFKWVCVYACLRACACVCLKYLIVFDIIIYILM